MKIASYIALGDTGTIASSVAPISSASGEV